MLRDRGGVWIGWSGTSDAVPGMADIFRGASREAGYVLEPVDLTQDEVEKYYHGYSNESVWPLFHDLQSRCNFEPDYWRAYVKVNRKFADALAARLPRRRLRLDPRLPVDGRGPPRARDQAARPTWPSSCTSPSRRRTSS